MSPPRTPGKTSSLSRSVGNLVGTPSKWMRPHCLRRGASRPGKLRTRRQSAPPHTSGRRCCRYHSCWFLARTLDTASAFRVAGRILLDSPCSVSRLPTRSAPRGIPSVSSGQRARGPEGHDCRSHMIPCAWFGAVPIHFFEMQKGRPSMSTCMWQRHTSFIVTQLLHDGILF